MAARLIFTLCANFPSCYRVIIDKSDLLASPGQIPGAYYISCLIGSICRLDAVGREMSISLAGEEP